MLPEDRKAKSADIFAAEKIIADISTGLYRTPAAALKELVSNAYDADAETVSISTDVPNFRNLVIEDDGSGMSVDRFLDVVRHIGGSKKRIEDGDVTPIKQRKIIGRIGIGLLAVAQLGYRFYVSSSKRGVPFRFIAEIDLEPYHKNDAALKSMGRLQENNKVYVGAVKYVEDIPEDEEAHYTVITIPDAKGGLISEVTSAVRLAVGATERLSSKSTLVKRYSEIVEVTRSSKRADTELDGYYYMLWELGLLCPVNYIYKTGPFDRRKLDIEGRVKLPMVKDFKLIVDGLEVHRPQLFPSAVAINYSSSHPKIFPISFDKEISGRKLIFVGYIYIQQPRIDPEELKGVHIRIRNVGIGTYDKSWLGYPFDEGFKFGQVSGEVHVLDGLESALNIDRDSFRETDVHYQALRAYLWDKLRKEVFPEFKSRQKTYSAKQKKKIDKKLENKFLEMIGDLPAPAMGKIKQVQSIDSPSLSDWIDVTEDDFLILSTQWEKFTQQTSLSKNVDQERFLRILRVLLSSEMLIDLTKEEANQLLHAIAIAIQ